ncbi:hypothetical protein Pan216_58180 [Planctomycetes bacterium Pan216]|uniref:Uncharacterized protein n=1 Tax=Kolteria novifilia TaxID=2527975 RepID=A0A518BD78_9BACT|nr:hypothetical protein Pan216_58180 [Planctomycetes bacterium Pan216]
MERSDASAGVRVGRLIAQGEPLASRLPLGVSIERPPLSKGDNVVLR